MKLADHQWILWLAYLAAFAWLVFDGGMGRVMAVVMVATLAICGVLIWIAKKIAGPPSD
jgi:hypothetical protein